MLPSQSSCRSQLAFWCTVGWLTHLLIGLTAVTAQTPQLLVTYDPRGSRASRLPVFPTTATPFLLAQTLNQTNYWTGYTATDTWPLGPFSSSQRLSTYVAFNMSLPSAYAANTRITFTKISYAGVIYSSYWPNRAAIAVVLPNGTRIQAPTVTIPQKYRNTLNLINFTPIHAVLGPGNLEARSVQFRIYFWGVSSYQARFDLLSSRVQGTGSSYGLQLWGRIQRINTTVTPPSSSSSSSSSTGGSVPMYLPPTINSFSNPLSINPNDLLQVFASVSANPSSSTPLPQLQYVWTIVPPSGPSTLIYINFTAPFLLSATNSPVLVVSGQRFGFVPATVYTFVLNVTDPYVRPIASTSQNVTVYINKPPEGGNCSVSPVVGGFALVTEFVVACANWQSFATPTPYSSGLTFLAYQVMYKVLGSGDETLRILTDTSNSSSLVVHLPAGLLQLTVVVSDLATSAVTPVQLPVLSVGSLSNDPARIACVVWNQTLLVLHPWLDRFYSYLNQSDTLEDDVAQQAAEAAMISSALGAMQSLQLLAVVFYNNSMQATQVPAYNAQPPCLEIHTGSLYSLQVKIWQTLLVDALDMIRVAVQSPTAYSDLFQPSVVALATSLVSFLTAPPLAFDTLRTYRFPLGTVLRAEVFIPVLDAFIGLPGFTGSFLVPASSNIVRTLSNLMQAWFAYPLQTNVSLSCENLLELNGILEALQLQSIQLSLPDQMALDLLSPFIGAIVQRVFADQTATVGSGAAVTLPPSALVGGGTSDITGDRSYVDVSVIVLSTSNNNVSKCFADNRGGNIVSDIIRINIYVPGSSNSTNVNGLDPNAPIFFDVPTAQSYDLCASAQLPVCSYWDPNNRTWETNGCVTISVDIPIYKDGVYQGSGVRCACTHLTDFALLLHANDFATCLKTKYANVFLSFTALYGLLAFIAFVQFSRLLVQLCLDEGGVSFARGGSRRSKAGSSARDLNSEAEPDVENCGCCCCAAKVRCECICPCSPWALTNLTALEVQHVLIACVCIFRLCVSLWYSHWVPSIDGVSHLGLALVLCAPYLFLFWSFSILIFQWAAVVRAMKTMTLVSFAKLRPCYIGVNVVIVVALLALFVSVGLDAGATGGIGNQEKLAFAGSVLLAVVYATTGLLFLVYGVRISYTVYTISKPLKRKGTADTVKTGGGGGGEPSRTGGGSNAGSTSGSSGGGSFPMTMCIVTALVSVGFIIEALISVLSVVEDNSFQKTTDDFLLVFLAVDLMCLTAMLVLFWSKVNARVEVARDNRSHVSTSRAGGGGAGGGSRTHGKHDSRHDDEGLGMGKRNQSASKLGSGSMRELSRGGGEGGNGTPGSSHNPHASTAGVGSGHHSAQWSYLNGSNASVARVASDSINESQGGDLRTSLMTGHAASAAAAAGGGVGGVGGGGEAGTSTPEDSRNSRNSPQSATRDSVNSQHSHHSTVELHNNLRDILATKRGGGSGHNSQTNSTTNSRVEPLSGGAGGAGLGGDESESDSMPNSRKGSREHSLASPHSSEPASGGRNSNSGVGESSAAASKRRSGAGAGVGAGAVGGKAAATKSAVKLNSIVEQYAAAVAEEEEGATKPKVVSAPPPSSANFYHLITSELASKQQQQQQQQQPPQSPPQPPARHTTVGVSTAPAAPASASSFTVAGSSSVAAAASTSVTSSGGEPSASSSSSPATHPAAATHTRQKTTSLADILSAGRRKPTAAEVVLSTPPPVPIELKQATAEGHKKDKDSKDLAKDSRKDKEKKRTTSKPKPAGPLGVALVGKGEDLSSARKGLKSAGPTTATGIATAGASSRSKDDEHHDQQMWEKNSKFGMGKRKTLIHKRQASAGDRRAVTRGHDEEEDKSVAFRFKPPKPATFSAEVPDPSSVATPAALFARTSSASSSTAGLRVSLATSSMLRAPRDSGAVAAHAVAAEEEVSAAGSGELGSDTVNATTIDIEPPAPSASASAAASVTSPNDDDFLNSFEEELDAQMGPDDTLGTEIPSPRGGGHKTTAPASAIDDPSPRGHLNPRAFQTSKDR